MKSAALVVAACLAAGVTNSCLADDLSAERQFTDTVISFALKGQYSNLVLTILGPNGLHARAGARDASPTIDLRRIGKFDDGIYKFNLTASTGEKVPDRSGLDDGRPGGPADSVLRSVSTSGQFIVKDGTIVKFDPAEREPSNRRK